VRLALLQALDQKVEEAVKSLNGVLTGAKAKAWREGKDPDLFRSERLHPAIAFEGSRGVYIGALYSTGTAPEWADMIHKVEVLGAGVKSPGEVTADYAVRVADTYFELDNAAGALPYYDRARQGPGLAPIDDERAFARTALCRICLGDRAKAIDDCRESLTRFPEVVTTVTPGRTHYRPQIMLYYAALLDNSGDTDGAIRVYQKIIEDYRNTGYDGFAGQAELELQAIESERKGPPQR
jgi:tetratricopeptide (TPR) repeat protein